MLGFLRGAVFVLLLMPAAASAADESANASFVYAESALSPAPSRGWVVLLPGDGVLAFATIRVHYQQTAKLLNAQGFDTLIVPYQEAYDEDLDGDPDGDGERIAAVTSRAVAWMHRAHHVSEDAPGALIAWGEGGKGLWALTATGGNYPLAKLVAAAAFYPAFSDEMPFSSRLPVLIEAGANDEAAKDLQHFLAHGAAGSVEPELVVHDNASRGFDVESFVKPKTVRHVPLFGAPTTLAYNAEAANAAEQKLLSFFKARLEAPE